MKKVIIFLCSLSTIICCTNDRHVYNETLLLADSTMEANQDSVFVSLNMLENIHKDVPNMRERDKMRYQLLYAKAMNKAYIDFTTDSIMLEVVDYYNSHGSNKDKLEAYYILGCVYRDLKDSPKAISCLYQATKFAGEDKFSYLMLSRIYGQIASLHATQALFNKAISTCERASFYSWLACDTVNAINYINLKAAAYSTLGKNDSAVIFKEKAIKMFKDFGYNKYAAQISSSCVEAYLNLGKYERVKENLSFYEQYSGYYNNGIIARGHETYYYGKGLVHLYSNKIDSARILFTKCAEFMDDPNMKIMYYRGLSLLYDKIQKPDSTAKYAMLAYEANDSAYQISAAQALLSLESAYDYGRYQEEAKSKAEEIAHLQQWQFCSIITIILMAFVSFLIYTIIKKHNRMKLNILHNRYETEKNLLQREMEELNALLEEKEYLLENKESEFLNRQNELNAIIEEKEQYICQLLQRVNKFEYELNIKDTAKHEEEIQASTIKKVFSYYLTHVNQHPTSLQWKELISFARKELPQTYMLLNAFNLSVKEMRICILLRLQFKPKEITTIIGCYFSDVTQIRTRLLKKIYGIDGKSVEFDRRLMLLH